MKITNSIARWVFIICLPLLLLTSTVHLGVNSTRLYEYGFDKYDISNDTGIDREQLSEIADRLVAYFKFKADTPQITVTNIHGEEFELFQEDDQNRELTHLADVRRLFHFNYLAQIVSFACIAIYVLLYLLWRKGRWQDLAKLVRKGCILTLATIAMLGMASVLVDFEQLFFQFHYLAFDNPWWISSGYLPRLFCQEFWEDVALLSGGVIVVEALFLGSMAWVIPSIHKRHSGQEH